MENEKSENEFSPKSIMNPNIQNTSWKAVIYICIISFGSMYSFQEVPALHDYFKIYFQKDYSDLFEFYFSLAQTISFGLSIFLSVFVGILCDLYSNSLVVMGQLLFTIIGQFFMCTSIYFGYFWFFFFGRILICSSGLSLVTSCKIFINYVSSEKQKGMTVGLQSSIILAGRFANLQIDPLFVYYYGLFYALMISFIIICSSFIAAYLGYFIEEEIRKQLNDPYLYSSKQSIVEVLESESYIINVDTEKEAKQEQENNKKKKSQFQQILDFDRKFWLYTFIISISILVTNTLDVLLPTYITSEWKMSISESTQISSICQFFGLFLWALGMLLDYCNHYLYEWLMISSILTSIGFLIINRINPILGSVVIGIGYNLRVALMIPLLSKIVKKESMGKAFGIVRSLKDLLATLFFLIISVVVAQTHSYESTFQMMMYLSLVFTTASFFLYLMRKKKF